MVYFASIGEKLKQIYGRWAQYIDPAGRFLGALAAFFWITFAIGTNEMLMNPFLILVIALLCSVMSGKMIAIAGGILIIAHAFSISLEAGAVTLVILFIVYALFLRFIPESAWASVLIPPAVFFGFPVLFPIVLGIKKKISALFAAAAGILIYHVCIALRTCAPEIGAMESSDYAGKIMLLLTNIFSQQCIVWMIGAAAVCVVVNIIRNLEVPHAFEIAIAAGGAAWVLFLILGTGLIGGELILVPVIVGALMSVFISMLLQLVFLPLDFRGGKKLRFEDDDYYYYVKAVPKFTSRNSREG